MSKIAVIYWSGTGNTEAMANAVAEGARAGGEVEVKSVSYAHAAEALAADALALGCPAMGAEVLEESEMEPFVQELEKAGLTGKKLALFGSYDWGDGEWMREWTKRMRDGGADLVADGLIVHNTPDEDGLETCRALGRKLAGL